MEDATREVSETTARIIGHICGVIFTALVVFLFWTIYRLAIYPKFSIGIAAFLFLAVAVTYFFGRTAIKLTSQKNPKIISRYGYTSIVVFLAAFSVLSASIAIFNIDNPDFTTADRIAFTVLSLAIALFAYHFYKLTKNQK